MQVCFPPDCAKRRTSALKPVVQSVLGESSAGGYATAAAGVETVDECGLRFLMAMKQHEYLLLCLPPKQRVDLKKQGLSSCNIIWAQHSDTETELLNAVPFMQKSNPTWEDIRSLGIAWWLKNTGSLTTCIEKLARAAFQKNQDPMDAALFYMAMKKKNVLTQLFKVFTVLARYNSCYRRQGIRRWPTSSVMISTKIFGRRLLQRTLLF